MKKIKYFLILSTFVFLVTFSGDCSKSEKYVFEVSSLFEKRANPSDFSESSSLVLKTDSNRTARTDKVSNPVSDISIDTKILKGSGVLPFEGFISMTYQKPQSDFTVNPPTFAGNMEWLKTHRTNLAVCSKVFWIEHAPGEYGYANSDTAINLGPVDEINAPLRPIYEIQGASYLAEIKSTDSYIPWIHPDVPTGRVINADDINSDKMHIDMSSISNMIFSSYSTAVTGSVNAFPTINWTVGGITIPIANLRLGGPNSDGDFKLRFVPQLQFNENGNLADSNNQVMRRPGIQFVFESTLKLVDAGLGGLNLAEFRIFMPAILMFNTTGSDGDLQVDFEPFASIARGDAQPTGFDKIIVTAGTPLGIQGQETAIMIRESLKNSLRNSTDALGIFITSTIAFSSGFNKYRKSSGTYDINFDVVTVPTTCVNHTMDICWSYNGLIDTQVLPAAPNSTNIASFVLLNKR
jgi:hypothetical protein